MVDPVKGQFLHRIGLPIARQNGVWVAHHERPTLRFRIWHAGRMRRHFLTMLWLVLLACACSIETSPPDTNLPTAPGPAVDNADEGVEEALGRPSSAFVQIGDTAYDLDAECYAAGVGEIVLTGLSPGLIEPRVELYVQAFLAEPYLGVSVTTNDRTVLHEPDLTIPFEIRRQDDVFRIDDVALVTDLDLRTGEAADAHRGTIVVECTSYVDGLPSGFGSE